MSADKCLSIFSGQMDAVVYMYSYSRIRSIERTHNNCCLLPFIEYKVLLSVSCFIDVNVLFLAISRPETIMDVPLFTFALFLIERKLLVVFLNMGLMPMRETMKEALLYTLLQLSVMI